MVAPRSRDPVELIDGWIEDNRLCPEIPRILNSRSPRYSPGPRRQTRARHHRSTAHVGTLDRDDWYWHELQRQTGAHTLLRTLGRRRGIALLLNRMVKKRIHALFHRAAPKMRFPACFIFNDLQSSKMAARPCAAHRLAKNWVFHQPVNSCLHYRERLLKYSVTPSTSSWIRSISTSPLCDHSTASRTPSSSCSW